MCNFFSVTSDGLGNIRYFNWEQRKQILSGELDYDPDSHTSINDFYGYKGADEDCRNKYEYNPLSGKFKVDMINGIDDSKEVEEKVKALDFKTICEPLIIKPIVYPFKVKNNGLEDRHVGVLKEWAKAGEIEAGSVCKTVRGTVGDSVWGLIRDTVGCLVFNSFLGSMRDATIGSIRQITYAYISSFFNLEKWKGINNAPYKNPFQSTIDLWEEGFVPSFDGKVWRLHSGENAEIVYEISEDELMNLELV